MAFFSLLTFVIIKELRLSPLDAITLNYYVEHIVSYEHILDEQHPLL